MADLGRQAGCQAVVVCNGVVAGRCRQWWWCGRQVVAGVVWRVCSVVWQVCPPGGVVWCVGNVAHKEV